MENELCQPWDRESSQCHFHHSAAECPQGICPCMNPSSPTGAAASWEDQHRGFHMNELFVGNNARTVCDVSPDSHFSICISRVCHSRSHCSPKDVLERFLPLPWHWNREKENTRREQSTGELGQQLAPV